MVGLGNPGKKYQLSRHNLGFMAIDAFAQSWPEYLFRSEHKSLVAKVTHSCSEVLLLAKPQTFMNLSGEAVQSLMSYYKIGIEDLLVLHDEIDLDFGDIRFQTHRGHGGHNGIRNIHQLLSTNQYKRLKLGVGRPPHSHLNVADYVLENFNKSEISLLSEYLNRICESLDYYIEQGFEKAATYYNRGAQRN